MRTTLALDDELVATSASVRRGHRRSSSLPMLCDTPDWAAPSRPRQPWLSEDASIRSLSSPIDRVAAEALKKIEKLAGGGRRLIGRAICHLAQDLVVQFRGFLELPGVLDVGVPE